MKVKNFQHTLSTFSELAQNTAYRCIVKEFARSSKKKLTRSFKYKCRPFRKLKKNNLIVPMS